MASAIGTMFGLPRIQSVFAAIALAPIFLWAGCSIGLWMTFKGFNRSALVEARLP